MAPVVRIKQGELRGKSCTGFRGQEYFSFEGIPYAKAPLGKLRFKAPQPPTPWTGVRDATTPASPCYARDMITNKLAGSEDCLYLNIYTPQVRQNDELKARPVLVYVSGGAFLYSSPSYTPDFILTGNLVVVTFHYRVGLLGFLSLKDTNLDTPGNAGLKDQIMVLRWVQENVSYFGGDPSNVTIYGDSVGAASCHLLMLSPMGKGLFHRVIAVSGTALNYHAKGQLTAPLIVQALNLTSLPESHILEILQGMTVEELLQLQEKFPKIHSNINVVRHIGPVVENVAPSQCAFLPEDPETIIKSGKFNHVPFMVGFASGEGMFWTILDKFAYGKLKIPESSIPYFFNLQSGTRAFEEVERKVEQFYFADTFSDYGFMKLQGDNYIIREVNKTVRLHTMVSTSPVYYFRLSLETSLNFCKNVFKLPYPGTCHLDILGYTFKTNLTPDIRPNSVEDVCMRRWIKMIANFAQSGNPNSTGGDSLLSIRWKPAECNKLNFLDIGNNLTIGTNPEEHRIQFWNDIESQNVSI